MKNAWSHHVKFECCTTVRTILWLFSIANPTFLFVLSVMGDNSTKKHYDLKHVIREIEHANTTLVVLKTHEKLTTNV